VLHQRYVKRVDQMMQKAETYSVSFWSLRKKIVNEARVDFGGEM
jgi:hypothetical protein